MTPHDAAVEVTAQRHEHLGHVLYTASIAGRVVASLALDPAIDGPDAEVLVVAAMQHLHHRRSGGGWAPDRAVRPPAADVRPRRGALALVRGEAIRARRTSRRLPPGPSGGGWSA